MVDLVEAFASAPSVDVFWINLAAILTDEVVIVEAQAAGMDWPEFAEGRRRLVATRDALVNKAWSAGWISRGEVHVFTSQDPQAAMDAARPWFEQEQRHALESMIPSDLDEAG